MGVAGKTAVFVFVARKGVSVIHNSRPVPVVPAEPGAGSKGQLFLPDGPKKAGTDKKGSGRKDEAQKPWA